MISSPSFSLLFFMSSCSNCAHGQCDGCKRESSKPGFCCLCKRVNVMLSDKEFAKIAPELAIRHAIDAPVLTTPTKVAISIRPEPIKPPVKPPVKEPMEVPDTEDTLEAEISNLLGI